MTEAGEAACGSRVCVVSYEASGNPHRLSTRNQRTAGLSGLAKVPALFLSPRHRWHFHSAESLGNFPGGDDNYQPRRAQQPSVACGGGAIYMDGLRGYINIHSQSPLVGRAESWTLDESQTVDVR